MKETLSEPHFNGLTPSEAERLAWLIEECAEVQQAATKILRHGYESRNPVDMLAESNRVMLGKEVGHMMAAVDIMLGKDIHDETVYRSRRGKHESLLRWMHHQ